MAPTRPSSKGLKGKPSTKSSSKAAPLGSKVSKKPSGPRPPPKQQKTKPLPGPVKKKERVYTDKELNIPQLNMITPIGVQKPRGKKKGKVFVDDPESMMTILAMVQADREGHIESKMAKARQMEEIRQARKAEMEKREAERTAKLERTKDSLRKKRTKRGDAEPVEEAPKVAAKPKKRVTFG